MSNLALEFASTLRHDGRGGVADDLADAIGLTGWVRERTGALGPWAARFTADEVARSALVELRRGVRALFAHAVAPAPPSRADAHRLLPLPEALARVNAAAARVPTVPQLDWVAGSAPLARTHWDEPDPVAALTALLARATVEFLAGPDRQDLRACTAPRCVRYFVKVHGRQEFCKPSCSNRARVARHYERQQSAAQVTEPTR